MLLQEGRSGAGISPDLAEGWRLERLTPPSRLFGANGLRTGPDGRIYIAQVTGSQISALDIETGRLETISAKGGDIIAPDDVAFDPRGNLYATEVMDGRVSARSTDGHTRVLRDDVPSANGITVHHLGRVQLASRAEGHIVGRDDVAALGADGPQLTGADVERADLAAGYLRDVDPAVRAGPQAVGAEQPAGRSEPLRVPALGEDGRHPCAGASFMQQHRC